MFVSLCALLSVLSSGRDASAHDDDGTTWGEDPADIVVADDCSRMQRNFYSVYALDYRLDRESAAAATRMELASEDGVVTGFTIASPGWRPHVEQPESLAHAERRSGANTLDDLLLRVGLEHRQGGSPDSIEFELRVFTGTESKTIRLEAPRVVEVDDPSGMELYRQWCHEPVDVPSGRDGAGPGASRASGGSVDGENRSLLRFLLGTATLGILGAAGVHLVLRRRR